MKVCRKCLSAKNESEFPKHKRTFDRLGSWCKECVKEAWRIWRSKHKAYSLLRTRKWEKDNPERFKTWKTDYMRSYMQTYRRQSVSEVQPLMK